MLRALVIGAGPTAALLHLPVLARLRDRGRLELRLICDLDQARAARAQQQFGFGECSGDAQAALARPDIDLVYIFASAQVHYACGHAALAHGKHLFVEKPIAPSYREALELAQLARARGTVAVGGLNRRFVQALSKVREQAGSTRWRYAEVTFHKPEFGKPPPFGARTWLTANGIHALDAMLDMMNGVPVHLVAFTDRVGDAVPATFSALMRWHDGAQGVFLCDNRAGVRREQYVFHGPGATFAADEQTLTMTRHGQSKREAMVMTGDGFEAEHSAFVDAIDSHTPPRHSLEAIAPSLFIAELIEAGFQGAVHLPAVFAPPAKVRPPQVPPQAVKRAVDLPAMLVVPSPELQPLLGQRLSKYRLVTLEDVLAAKAPLADIEAAILGRGAAPLPSAVLDRLPSLRVVGIMALSLARHEPQRLLDRGIALLNATQAYAETVAEFALALATLARRRAFISHSTMRSGGWGVELRPTGLRGWIRRLALRVRPAATRLRIEAPLLRLWRAARAHSQPTHASVPARDLQGARVGLIGWGANARAFAVRLIGAGAQVQVYSEHAPAAQIQAIGAVPAPLGEVLSCEIVSLHRGLTPVTRHCIGAAELAQLRPGSVLINVARGALIEPRALLTRLRRGDVFACLDTYDEEPPAASDPLRALDNVFLTSHIAGGSRDMHAAAAEEVVNKTLRFLAGQTQECIGADRLRTMT